MAVTSLEEWVHIPLAPGISGGILDFRALTTSKCVHYIARTVTGTQE